MKTEGQYPDVKEDAETKIKHLELMLASCPAVIYTCKPFGDYPATFMSEYVTEMLGYQPSDFLKSSSFWVDNIHPQDKKGVFNGLSLLFDKDYHLHEYRFKHINGSYRWMRDEMKLIRDDDGKPLEIVGSWTDITPKKQAQLALEDSENRYRSFVTNFHGIAYRATLGFKIIFFHGAVEEITGYTEAELVAGNPRWDQVIFPDDLDAAIVDGEKMRSLPNFSYEREYRIVRKDGQIKWIYEFAKNVCDKSGRPECVEGVIYDISKRKKVEETLHDSEALYRELVETTAAIAWEMDVDSLLFTYISPQVEKLTGYPQEAWTDFSFWAERIHPDDRERAVELCQAETAKGLDHAFEYRMFSADDRILWIRDVVSIIKDQGRPVSLRGYLIDITESKVAHEKIRVNEEFIRNILETVDQGILVIDRDYRIQTANKAYCRQVCLSEEEIIGTHCYESSHKKTKPCYELGEECVVRGVFEDGASHSAFHRHSGPEDSTLYVETKAFPIKNSSGKVVSAIETINNITERFLLEEERLKTQKLESIGTLAGGIAHDFNNLLQGVFGFISIARMTIDKKEKSLAMLEQAEKALHQTVNLTHQLLTFSKGGKPVKEQASPLSIIEDAARFALSGSPSEYETQISEDVWDVSADPGQIGQVIQNIVLNADQAMPQGGKVIISLDNLPAGGVLPPGLEKGDYVMFTIHDNGIGIPEKYLNRIFDPYFTTKEKGSGLGLATSFSIVKNHGGTIDVRSEMGNGSTFSLYLPAIKEKEAKKAVVEPPKESSRHARVLIMDDDEMILKVAEKMLNSFGYESD